MRNKMDHARFFSAVRLNVSQVEGVMDCVPMFWGQAVFPTDD